MATGLLQPTRVEREHTRLAKMHDRMLVLLDFRKGFADLEVERSVLVAAWSRVGAAQSPDLLECREAARASV